MDTYEISSKKAANRAAAPVNNEIGYEVPLVGRNWFRWPGCKEFGSWELGVTIENEHKENAYVFRDGAWYPVVGYTYGEIRAKKLG